MTIREPSGLNDAELTLIGVPLEREDLGAGPGVPDLRRLVRDSPVTTREPSGLNDAELSGVGVPLEREDLGAGPGVPDLRRLVVTRGDDPRPVGAERRRDDADRCAP